MFAYALCVISSLNFTRDGDPLLDGHWDPGVEHGGDDLGMIVPGTVSVLPLSSPGLTVWFLKNPSRLLFLFNNGEIGEDSASPLCKGDVRVNVVEELVFFISFISILASLPSISGDDEESSVSSSILGQRVLNLNLLTGRGVLSILTTISPDSVKDGIFFFFEKSWEKEETEIIVSISQKNEGCKKPKRVNLFIYRFVLQDRVKCAKEVFCLLFFCQDNDPRTPYVAVFIPVMCSTNRVCSTPNSSTKTVSFDPGLR
jgi:hypothetical protein